MGRLVELSGRSIIVVVVVVVAIAIVCNPLNLYISERRLESQFQLTDNLKVLDWERRRRNSGTIEYLKGSKHMK